MSDRDDDRSAERAGPELCLAADEGQAFERSGARPTRLAAYAVILASVALGLPGSGCLNPRPEEVPGAGLSFPDELEPAPARVVESCEDNPLLSGCDTASLDVGAPNATAAPGGEDADEQGVPADDAEPAGAPAYGAAGEAGGEEPDAGDAGADVPADAGAG